MTNKFVFALLFCASSVLASASSKTIYVALITVENGHQITTQYKGFGKSSQEAIDDAYRTCFEDQKLKVPGDFEKKTGVSAGLFAHATCQQATEKALVKVL